MTIRLLTAADAAIYKVVRLRALKEHPEAFGQSPELVQTQEAEQIVAGLKTNPTFGAFTDKDKLIGITSIARNPRPKLHHRAWIGGMYVIAEQQGQGWGRRLLEVALAHVREDWDGIEDVVLAVTVGNESAKTLYAKFGFVTWGIDPRYLKLEDGSYHDIEWMILSLNA